jgi:protease-4
MRGSFALLGVHLAMSTVPPNEIQVVRQPTPTTQVVIQQPTAFGRYGRFLIFLLVIAVIVIIGQNASYRNYFSPADAPTEKYHSLSKTATNKVAIINIEGAILSADGYIKKQIDRVREDKDVKAIVLRIDSPGGTVTASDALYHQLRKLATEDRGTKEDEFPIVVSMGGMCASGGYYLAMAAGGRDDVIFAEPSTWTGSIGVVIPHYDVSQLLANWKVQDDSVVSDKFKLMGSPTRQLSPEQKEEERKLLQELVDLSFARFKEVVLGGRPKLKDDEKSLKTATTGRIFTAQQAKDLKLVDELGFLDEAIARAVKLAGGDAKSMRCVKYEEPPGALKMILGADAPVKPAAAQWDLSAVLDLTAPRAYYLCTWLPAVLSTGR